MKLVGNSLVHEVEGFVSQDSRSPLRGLYVRLVGKPWGLFRVVFKDMTNPKEPVIKQDLIMPGDFIPSLRF